MTHPMKVILWIHGETLKVVPVGNSKGVRLPIGVLRRYHVEEELELIEAPDGILLRPKRFDKLSFEESFREMANLGVQGSEIDEFDGTLGDGLETDNYTR